MPNKKDENLFNKLHNKTIVCVGSDLYDDDTNFYDLPMCKTDAQSVYNAFILTSALKCASDDAVLLINDGHQTVTKQAVLSVLNKLSGKTDIKKHQFIFYFSGHGYPLNDDLALVVKDSKLDNTDSLLMLSEIIESIGKIKCDEKIVILDSCYSGRATKPGAKAISPRKTIEKLINNSKGIIFVASSLDNQESYAGSPSDCSLFTHFLIEALSGKPDALNNYWLSLFNMYAYVVNSMKKFCGERRLQDQTPSINCWQDGIMYLGYYKFDRHNWYKDNFETIHFQSTKDQVEEYIQGIDYFLDKELWTDSSRVIYELILNAFKHGHAKKCEITICKNSIEILDNGLLFNQFENCSIEGGGLSYCKAVLEKKWENDAQLSYEQKEKKNSHKIEFDIETAFDISKNTHIALTDLNENLSVAFDLPKVVCKYYFLDISQVLFISTKKNLIDEALSIIPSQSFIVLEDNEDNRILSRRFKNIILEK